MIRLPFLPMRENPAGMDLGSHRRESKATLAKAKSPATVPPLLWFWTLPQGAEAWGEDSGPLRGQTMGRREPLHSPAALSKVTAP